MTNKLKEFISKNASLIDDPSISLEDLVSNLEYIEVMSTLTKDEKAAFIIYYQVAVGNLIFISLQKSKKAGGVYESGYLNYNIRYKPGEWLEFYSIPLTVVEEKGLSSKNLLELKKFATDLIFTYLSPELDNLDSNLVFNIIKLMGEN